MLEISKGFSIITIEQQTSEKDDVKCCFAVHFILKNMGFREANHTLFAIKNVKKKFKNGFH
jgi:hypothetical protein